MLEFSKIEKFCYKFGIYGFLIFFYKFFYYNISWKFYFSFAMVITTLKIATTKLLAKDSTETLARRSKFLARRSSVVEATPQMMPISSDSLFRAIATNAALIGQLSYVAKFELSQKFVIFFVIAWLFDTLRMSLVTRGARLTILWLDETH